MHVVWDSSVTSLWSNTQYEQSKVRNENKAKYAVGIQ
jgi:hypothetical protein